MSWQTVRLGDICEIVSGATPKTSRKEYWDGDILWATPADLSKLDNAYISVTPRRITDAGLKSCAASVLPEHSVLLSSRAPIGHVAINTVPMATNQGFKSLVPNKKIADAKFLYHWLVANRSRIQSLGNGATFKEISKSIVSSIEIFLPPLEEQRRIAAILDKADALRQKRKQAIALFDSLTQSIFLEMFGDPFSDKQRNDQKRVDFAEVTTRITYGFTQPMSHLESGIPIITAKNVRNGHIDYGNVHYTSRSEFDRLTAKSKPEQGDLLITKDGAIGRSALVEGDAKFCINQSVCLVKPRHDLIAGQYLLHYLLSGTVQSRIEAMKKGNAIPHLQITELAKFPIFIPNKRLQTKFADKVERIGRVRAAGQVTIAKATDLFSSLQHRAFSGQL